MSQFIRYMLTIKHLHASNKSVALQTFLLKKTFWKIILFLEI